MNEHITCDTKSPRAQKARVAARLDSSSLRTVLILIEVGLLMGWAWLVLAMKLPVGNLLLAGMGAPLMALFWYKGELRDLAPTAPIAGANDLSAVLERHILARLPAEATPKAVASIIAKQPGGYFYAARYAVGADFIQNLSSDLPQEMHTVWRRSIELAMQNQCDQVDSAVIAAALILAIPEHDAMLAHLQLDSDDILKGVQWYEHMRMAVEYHHKRRSYGGFGRDLSFGWAPTLNHVGLNMTYSIERGGLLLRMVNTHNQVIDQAMHVLSQPGRRNVVLVGEVGVGKTTIVYALAQKLLEEPNAVSADLRYRQVISLDAANLIANAQGRGQLESLLIQVFNEAVTAKNVILFLDEAQLFLREGTGSVDLSSLLMPVLEGGALRLILSMTDQEWLRLSQTNPGLAQLMNRVIVKAPDAGETMQVVEDQVLLLESKSRVVYMHQSLEEAYKLADRFINEQAFPGKAIKLLEAAAGFAEQQHFITATSVQQAVEKAFGVRVQTANTIEEKDTLLNLEQLIHQRMINQTRAVKLVSDALRRARAGVRNEQKPIGTFLFLGPTGVGKTELTKALASVYFGGDDRMVRVDLNEFSQPTDTSRLLATGATDPYSLCAQIAKQPFSVVLLDEIEKAHPNVLNLLLQMLDEGTLRDSENKPVSFRDAIIIATSNAGADKIRAHIDKGEKLEQFEKPFVDELIDANVFRPEFLNRFDEIVLFRPLNQDELMQVVDLLMATINRTLASRKVTVALTDEAKKLLVRTGYDPRLGARPLRRVVQRAVENVVAQRLLRSDFVPGQTMQLDAAELQATLDARE